MITQIVTMTVAGMTVRNKIPTTQEKFLERLKEICSAIMKEPPTDEEIDKALQSGVPLEFTGELVKNVSVEKI